MRNPSPGSNDDPPARYAGAESGVNPPFQDYNARMQQPTGRERLA